MTKAELRQTFIKRRLGLSLEDQTEAAVRARLLFLDNIDVAAGAVVAAYWPVRGEIDCLPLMWELRARGASVALPALTETEAVMTFRLWDEAARMEAGRFGIPIPRDGKTVRPDLVIVPLVAFDAAGNRLGYGGGFYDAALAALGDVPAVGFAYDMQRHDSALPRDAHDVSLPVVVTDKAVYRFG